MMNELKIRLPKMSRRNFIRLALYPLPLYCFADAFCIEPAWVKVRKITLRRKPVTRIVHFSDLHHKGDRSYLAAVIGKINELSPDFVCFTGDIVEDRFYLDEALELLRGVRSPMFGVPGNHDYSSGASFAEIAASFKETGGAWLVDRETTAADGSVVVFGASSKDPTFAKSAARARRILLTHYPAFVDEIENDVFDLILAGHSHGGQVRIPFWGALILPVGVGKYDKGIFQTSAGPLYVNPGIGTWYVPVRFCCRPEITVIEF